MRVILSVIISICGSNFIFAQSGSETTIPLSSNSILQMQSTLLQVTKPTNENYFGKTETIKNFPFIDFFRNPGTELNDSLWDLKQVKKNQFSAILNAQDANGFTYSNNDNQFRANDVLLSNLIDLTKSAGNLFIDITYSTGQTWQVGDSLLIEGKTPSGNYNRIIGLTPFNPITQSSLSVNLNFLLFESPNFDFRITCYTTSRTANAETFLVHKIVLSDKLILPYYENFTPYLKDSMPTKKNWQQSPGKVLNGSRFGFNTGANVFVLNAQNEAGQTYNNANGGDGFADTLSSQPIDLTKVSLIDSVYLRFYYQTTTSTSTTDSLMLEFLNNTGQWIPVWKSGTTNQQIKFFIQQVNFGRFRHSFFKFRLINKCKYATRDSLQFVVTGFHFGQKTQLPFVDDFSQTDLYPNIKKWTDKYVYVNNDFAIRPPSINVATFDGLDAKGNAYGQGNGILDTLTSVAINLNGLGKQDSVYLSFFVQPKGLGDAPNPEDVLFLEFRNNGGFFPTNWQTVWSGTVLNYLTTRFTQVYVLVDSSFLHDDFQFRFKNYGSRTGNLDNWHLDYVQLDRGRQQNDGYFDAAISNTPSSLLNTYFSMPRNHYNASPTIYTNTQQNMILRLNHNIASPINFGRVIFNAEENRIDSFGNTGGLLNPKSDTTVSLFSNPLLTNSTTKDSIVFRTRYYTNLNNNLDNIVTNDTFSVYTTFSNYFAYDDGTAEAGYGLKNEAGGVALGYKLEVPDTLFGISIFFNQSTADVSTQPFNLMVWSAIGTGNNGIGETVLKRIPFNNPVYINKRNGFYYFQFDAPLALPAGTFYIGWEQISPYILNVGFDRNYQRNGIFAKTNQLFFKLNDEVWQSSNENGALMIRPIVGKWLNPPVGVKELKEKTQFDATIYPNPASTIVNVRSTQFGDIGIEIMDMAGKIVATNNSKEKMVYLPQLSQGIYFVRITVADTKQMQVKKIIISQ